MTKAKRIKSGAKRDRDENGHYLPGHGIPGPGRPRRPDWYAAAEEGAAREKVDLRVEIWLITKQLIALAKAGDVQAAKLVGEKITDQEPQKHEHSGKVTLESLVLASVEKAKGDG